MAGTPLSSSLLHLSPVRSRPILAREKDGEQPRGVIAAWQTERERCRRGLPKLLRLPAPSMTSPLPTLHPTLTSMTVWPQQHYYVFSIKQLISFGMMAVLAIANPAVPVILGGFRVGDTTGAHSGVPSHVPPRHADLH